LKIVMPYLFVVNPETMSSFLIEYSDCSFKQDIVFKIVKTR
jgi:hypothetical protein